MGQVSKPRDMVYLLNSNTDSHMLHGETAMEILTEVYDKSHQMQRMKYDADMDTPILHQCDGATVFFSKQNGLSRRRKTWYDNNHVIQPHLEEAGWSAVGQALDKLNNHYKRRFDDCLDAKLGLSGCLGKRKSFEDHLINNYGTFPHVLVSLSVFML